MVETYIAPDIYKDGFHCPHCQTYSKQRRYFLWRGGTGTSQQIMQRLRTTFCDRCGWYSLWLEDEAEGTENGTDDNESSTFTMIYPMISIASLPSNDMPEDVKEDFLEAREVVNASPRAAAALLRLALQKLMVHLGEKGENIDTDIRNLVKKGLPEQVQKALDIVRVVGNNAVHPGQIDLRDDEQTALALFEIMNFIVQETIVKRKKIDEIYERLPATIRETIAMKDGSKS